MSTENEEWRDSSNEENTGAGRDGNRSYNREGGYNRPSYNREGGDRPYRPRFNPNSEGGERRSYGDRPQRPSYNREGGDRPYRPRFNNNEGGERRSYGDRPQRPSYNREGGDRPYRPRFNNGGEGRPQGFVRPQRRTGDYDPNAKYSKKKQIEYKEQFVPMNPADDRY